MPITTKDGLLEAWATQLETMEQTLESLYGPPGITPTLPAITTHEGMLEAIETETQKAYVNFAKVNGAYHDAAEDIYAMLFPKTIIDYYGLKIVGGKTIVWNQLVDSGTSSVTLTAGHKYYTVINGTESIVTGDGSAVSIVSDTADMVIDLTLMFGSGNEPATATAFRTILPKDHYSYDAGTLLSMKVTGIIDSGKNMLPETFPSNTINASMNTSTIASASNSRVFAVPCEPNTEYRLIKSSSGTSWYVGFLNKLPAVGNTVYNYVNMTNRTNYAVDSGNNIYMVIGVASTSALDALKSKEAIIRVRGTNTDYVAYRDPVTYAIPAEVQALEGYGLSCPGAYNYIDFEAKKFVQNVGFVDLSTLTFGYGPSVGWSATLPNVKNPADDDTAFNGLSATLKVTDRNTQATAFSDGTDAGMVSVAGGKVYVGTGSISIVPSGTLIYELDEPIETDISEYIDIDIPTVSSDSLEFANQNGEYFRVPVPVNPGYIGL